MGLNRNQSHTGLTAEQLIWDPLPAYQTVFNDLLVIFGKAIYRYQTGSYRFPQDISEDLEVLCDFTQDDLAAVTGLAVALTVVRACFTRVVLRPLGKYLKLKPENASKLPESIWKLLYYCFAWGYAFRILVTSGRYRFLQSPGSVWDGYSPEGVVPSDIYKLYAVQGAFYLHGLHALFWQDAWRKDSPVMAAHHVVTLALIWFSFVCRYHNVGAMVMLFHDFCDIELEFAKINVYLKDRGGFSHKLNDTLASVSFLAMTITWFMSRLYYFPLKVLWACSSALLSRNLLPEYTLLMLSMLLLLTSMNVFWFSQMLILLYKIATGEVSEVEDLREYDVTEELERKNLKKLQLKKSK